MIHEGMLKANSLKGKTIIVTGGGTGLGKAMGTYFLELGANLVITSRKMDVLEKTASEMEAATGGKVLPVACDVRDYEAVEAVINAAETEFGSVNGLLNNAAGNFVSPTERLSANAFSTVIDIVFNSLFKLLKSILPFNSAIVCSIKVFTILANPSTNCGSAFG